MKYIQLYQDKECEECWGWGEIKIGKERVVCPECEGNPYGMQKDRMVSLEELKELIK